MVSLVTAPEPGDTSGHTWLSVPDIIHRPIPGTPPLRILPAVNITVFVMLCTVFALHLLGTGLYPGAMGSRLDDHERLMWMAAGILLSGAPVIPLLGLRTSR